ncbi:MAG: DUF4065 domain-containing protein [Oscillospiraceae bacterium]|nr:DUF4065 domain-containing protein [Oscillospiraceae bacterium]
MERVYDVAQYIFNEYKHISGQIIDEMKLQKLLYYSQRESFAILGKPMFDAEFEGWRYGPVCRAINSVYTKEGLSIECSDIAFDNAYIVRNVISEYGVIESWELSKMSHREISWKNARCGLRDDENGTTILELSDIKKDSAKIRPYDHLWDMYYDEFEDVENMCQ